MRGSRGFASWHAWKVSLWFFSLHRSPVSFPVLSFLSPPTLPFFLFRCFSASYVCKRTFWLHMFRRTMKNRRQMIQPSRQPLRAIFSSLKIAEPRGSPEPSRYFSRRGMTVTRDTPSSRNVSLEENYPDTVLSMAEWNAGTMKRTVAASVRRVTDNHNGVETVGKLRTVAFLGAEDFDEIWFCKCSLQKKKKKIFDKYFFFF